MRQPRNIRRIAFALPLVAAWVLAIASPAGAAQTYTVTQLTDHGGRVSDDPCSLRDASDTADSSPGADTIVLPAGTVRIDQSGADEDNDTFGDFDIKGTVTVRGQGATATTVQSFVPNQRVFDVRGVDFTLQALGVAG